MNLFQPETRSEIKKLLAIAWPLALAQLGFLAMGFVDTWMVADLGPEAIGGVAIANAIFFVIALMFSAALLSLDAIIGQRIGSGNEDQCGSLLMQAYWIGLVAGVVITVPVLLLSSTIGTTLAKNPIVGDECSVYLWARAWSFTPFLLFAAQRGFLSGVGTVRPLVVIVIVANILNALADWVFIYGHFGMPAMGTRGAGYASTVSACVLLLCLYITIHHTEIRERYRFRFARPRFDVIGGILRLGGPFALHILVEVGAFSTITILAAQTDKISLAAHHIAWTYAALTFMVPLGISVAASVRVAHCLGQGDRSAAQRAGNLAIFIGIAYTVGTSLLLLVFREPLVRVFLDNAEVVRTGGVLLMFAAAFQISDGMQVIGAGVLRGTGDTRKPFIANLIGHWVVGVPLGAYLAFGADLGVRGLWVGTTLALTTVAIVLVFPFLRGQWREYAGLEVDASEPATP